MATTAYARQRNQGLGSGQAIMYQNPKQEVAKRAPTSSDKKEVGTFWFQPVDINNTTVGNLYVQTETNGSGWQQITFAGGGGAGVFSSLTVTPGPISLTGTTTFTGNATASGNITAQNLFASTGNVEAVMGAVQALTDITSQTGSLRLQGAGGKIFIATGANASVGTATLVAGTVTIANENVFNSSLIFVSRKTAGGTLGQLTASNIVPGTSFDIFSDEATETSTVNWWIIN